MVFLVYVMYTTNYNRIIQKKKFVFLCPIYGELNVARSLNRELL